MTWNHKSIAPFESHKIYMSQQQKTITTIFLIIINQKVWGFRFRINTTNENRKSQHSDTANLTETANLTKHLNDLKEDQTDDRAKLVGGAATSATKRFVQFPWRSHECQRGREDGKPNDFCQSFLRSQQPLANYEVHLQIGNEYVQSMHAQLSLDETMQTPDLVWVEPQVVHVTTP